MLGNPIGLPLFSRVSTCSEATKMDKYRKVMKPKELGAGAVDLDACGPQKVVPSRRPNPEIP